MKTLKILFLLFSVVLLLNSCEEDGDYIQVSGLESSELQVSESDVVLTTENSTASVLALTWDQSTLSSSNAAVDLPSSIPYVLIEVSATNTFDSFEEIIPTGTLYSFTGAALNTLGKNLGFSGGVSSPMYFRLNIAYAVNTDPFYSNVASVNVTCYTIDMSLGYILNADKEDTGFKLYSPNSDGEYSGFTGNGSWFNWYLQEGDGTVWGNVGADGNEFKLSNDAGTFWNFWYPGQNGCYYTTLSTNDKVWTATFIPTLTLSGDVDTTMTFDKANVKWYVSLTTTSANSKIKVSSTDALLYNASTGTDNASAIAKTLGFIANSDSTLSIDWNSASATDITIPEAGDYTLTFYLANPGHWTYELSSGSVVIVEKLTSKLYLPGVDDGISGSWTFDNYLSLINEDDSTFGGVIQVNSLWGYQMALELDNWDDYYAMGATEGTLAFKSSTNITAPTAGLYLIEADLKNLSYSHTEVTGLGYSGINDDWSSITPMDEAAVTGVYTSTITLSSVSEWGFQFLLNNDWNANFGGAEGVLKYKGANLIVDASLATGSYDIVANVLDTSYVFLGNEVYIVGLNDVWDFTSVVLSKTSMGVYSGTATINTASPWGIQIHLDQSWNRYFGGSFSSMKYLGDNITDDQSLASGTYNVTVDFINNTCSFVVQ
jgi:hypothetical protein